MEPAAAINIFESNLAFSQWLLQICAHWHQTWDLATNLRNWISRLKALRTKVHYFHSVKCINVRNIGPFFGKIETKIKFQLFLSSKLSLFLNRIPCIQVRSRQRRTSRSTSQYGGRPCSTPSTWFSPRCWLVFYVCSSFTFQLRPERRWHWASPFSSHWLCSCSSSQRSCPPPPLCCL